MPKIEEDGKSWLRRPKLYKGVVEPYKKKKVLTLPAKSLKPIIFYEYMHLYETFKCKVTRVTL